MLFSIHFISFFLFFFFRVFVCREDVGGSTTDVDGSGREWWSKERKPAAGCLLKITIQEASNRSFRHRANHTHTSNNNDVNNVSSHIHGRPFLSLTLILIRSISRPRFSPIDRTRTKVNRPRWKQHVVSNFANIDYILIIDLFLSFQI